MVVPFPPGRAKNAARATLGRRLGEIGFRDSVARDVWVSPLDEGGERGFYAVGLDFYPIARMAYLWEGNGKNDVTKCITVRAYGAAVSTEDPYIGSLLDTIRPSLSDFLGKHREQFISESIATIVREYDAAGIDFDDNTSSKIREMHDSKIAVPYALLSADDVERWADLIVPATRSAYDHARTRVD
ncbi:hypothetical protein GCM10009809_25880 [Isoptericola hypogeus]|uniref:Uncharacterized protein n=1 Tax=Isoptericola hypogeus TaxID=300179 RepID=A0ABN2JJ79_9MICO